MTEIDPFDALRSDPAEDAVAPRPEFARRLRRRLADALGNPAEVPLADADDTHPDDTHPDDTHPHGARPDAARADGSDLPTIDLPERSPAMPSTSSSTASSATAAQMAAVAPTLVPYLAVHDGAAAIDWYEHALDARLAVRYDGDDGRIGHAELAIGPARIYLADEFPEIGVVSPRTLGGTPVALHLSVVDVDATFARAVAAGATALSEPGDQPHGARHGTLLDPFGHRWMLSQPVEVLDADTIAERMADSGWATTTGPASSPDRVAAVARNGRIWPAIAAADAPALIRTAIDVLGFTEQIVVPGDGEGVVAHSQLAWPEGGVVQISTAHREGNVFSEQAIGTASIYVVTDDPMAVHRRCVAAGLEIVREPESPDYDPGGSGFGLRDPEGNLWSFGTYAGE